MPSLTLKEVVEYSPFSTKFFVETGTYLGDTIENVKYYFDKIYSIELDKNYASRASDRFINEKHVNIINADSSDALFEICKNIECPAFFWLDGHWSGPGTAKGAKDCPLLEELEQIMNNCKQKCVVAIDDVRLFGTNGNEDWSSITRESVLNLVESRLETCTYYPSDLDKEDRMVLILGPRKV